MCSVVGFLLLILQLKKQQQVHNRVFAKIQKASRDHIFDFSKTSSLFTVTVESEANLLALLTQNNSDIYLKSRAFTSGLTITGDNVKIDGMCNALSAKDETLECSCTVAGNIILEGGASIYDDGYNSMEESQYQNIKN